MVALPVRKEVVDHLDRLSDEEVALVLEFIKTVESIKESEEPYPITIEQPSDDDPAIGFFSGPPGLARSAKTILHRELGLPKLREERDK